MRLVNRSLTSTGHGSLRSISGVVQVCVNREYGYICADDWDNREAEVVCRSLAYQAPYFGMTLHVLYIKKIQIVSVLLLHDLYKCTRLVLETMTLKAY